MHIPAPWWANLGYKMLQIDKKFSWLTVAWGCNEVTPRLRCHTGLWNPLASFLGKSLNREDRKVGHLEIMGGKIRGKIIYHSHNLSHPEKRCFFGGGNPVAISRDTVKNISSKLPPKKTCTENLPNITKPKKLHSFGASQSETETTHRKNADPSHCGRLMALTMLLWSCTLRWGMVMASWSATYHVPSGYVKIAIENGPVEIVDFPNKNGDFQ